MKKATEGNKESVRMLMSHVVFMPKYYIFQAKTRVKMYSQLCEHGYLPDNWADIQKEYYILSSKGRISFPEQTLPGDPDADLPYEEMWGVISEEWETK